MTISQLIGRLQQYPQDTQVFVSGYEGGMDYLDTVEDTRVVLDYNKGVNYLGRHEEAEAGLMSESDMEKSVRGIWLR